MLWDGNWGSSLAFLDDGLLVDKGFEGGEEGNVSLDSERLILFDDDVFGPKVNESAGFNVLEKYFIIEHIFCFEFFIFLIYAKQR